MSPSIVGLEVLFPNERCFVSTKRAFKRVIRAWAIVLISGCCGD